MNGRRQSLTAPGGGGGGGGGGSRRILAATLTFTGAPGTRPNQITGTVTGTCPDPATVLPGGTLQSIQYWVSTQVDSNITLQYKSVGAVSDARVPYLFNINGVEYVANQSFNITASSIGQTVPLTNANLPRIVEQDATGFVFPFTPAVTLRVGEPNYGRETGTTVVAENFLVNSLQLDGTIKVYYLFE